MVLLLKKWRSKRDLINLSKRHSFQNLKPQTVIDVLERFADLHEKCNQKITDIGREPSNNEQRRALLGIWEQARKQIQLSPENKEAWRRVMVSCNALYESSLGISSRSKSVQIAA